MSGCPLRGMSFSFFILIWMTDAERQHTYNRKEKQCNLETVFWLLDKHYRRTKHFYTAKWQPVDFAFFYDLIYCTVTYTIRTPGVCIGKELRHRVIQSNYMKIRIPLTEHDKTCTDCRQLISLVPSVYWTAAVGNLPQYYVDREKCSPMVLI